MVYLISFYSDEWCDTESDYLFEDHSEICDGHFRIGDMNPESSSMVCELYRVYNEVEFIRLVKSLQKIIPHLEAYQQVI